MAHVDDHRRLARIAAILVLAALGAPVGVQAIRVRGGGPGVCSVGAGSIAQDDAGQNRVDTALMLARFELARALAKGVVSNLEAIGAPVVEPLPVTNFGSMRDHVAWLDIAEPVSAEFALRHVPSGNPFHPARMETTARVQATMANGSLLPC